MTVSVPKLPRRYLVFLTIVIAVLIGLGAGIVYKADQAQPKLKAGGKTFQLEVANTEATRQQGLSGRDSMSEKTAMLFVFDATNQHCFWMKDMKFNIDIVWLDASKKVGGTLKDVTPTSYPETYCFNDSQYVVEFRAGTVERLGLKYGDQFSW